VGLFSALLQLSGSWTVSTWIKLASLSGSGAMYAAITQASDPGSINYGICVDNGHLCSGTAFAVDFYKNPTDYRACYSFTPKHGNLVSGDRGLGGTKEYVM